MSEEIVLRPAVKAVLHHKGKVLILQKGSDEKNAGQTGRWDLPGGKVKPGEHFLDGLRREVFEETGINDIKIGQPFFMGEWRPVVRGITYQIVCTFWDAEAQTDQVMVDGNEHATYRWIDPKDNVNYDMMSPQGDVINKFIEISKN